MPAFTSYLRTFLSLRGYDARCYSRGDELLAAMKQSELPDAVLLDVMMPGLDGMATLRALKASRPEAQVIMLSGRNQASTIVEAVQAGATDYVVKPDDPEGLGEIALDVAIKNAIEKNRLVSELSELRQQLSDNEDQAVWGSSDGMRRITTVIEQVGDSDVTVLIRGESGVGKELVSRAIHQQSTRRQRPFVKVNCAALRPSCSRASSSDTRRGLSPAPPLSRIGKFEQADGGTLMLDEIGELTPALQAKLLHVLQDAEFTKLGSNKRVEVDVRVVAATNRDLETMMLGGGFREDLYYRLQSHRADGPALRERRDEIPTLIESFIARYARKYRRSAPRLSPQLRQLFLQYDWPGNIRELENMIKRLVILQDEQIAFAEIERSMRRVASAPATAAVGAGRAARRGRSGRPRHGRLGQSRRGWLSPLTSPRGRHGRGRRRRTSGRCRRLAGDCRAGGGDEGRTGPHRENADSGALEPPQSLANTWRELQDAPQQNQGMLHHPGLSG